MSQSSEQFLQQREYEQGLLQETTKLQRQEYVTSIIQQMDEGNVDPLKIHLQLKCTESIIDMFTDKEKHPLTSTRYSELLLAAAQLHGTKPFELHNAKFQIRESGTKYDYSQTGHTKLLEMYKTMEALKADIKAVEEFLKTVPAAGLEIGIDDELVKVYPPAKRSTTTLFTTLK